MENLLSHELGGRDALVLCGLPYLVPFGIGEADAPVLAGEHVMPVVGVAGFGVGRIVDGHGQRTRGGTVRSSLEARAGWDAGLESRARSPFLLPDRLCDPRVDIARSAEQIAGQADGEIAAKLA